MVELDAVEQLFTSGLPKSQAAPISLYEQTKLTELRKREGKGYDQKEHPNSSAFGPYGLTNAAYQDVQGANPYFQGKKINQLTPEEHDQSVLTLHKDIIAPRLSQIGVEPTEANLQLAHFLGPVGAAAYLKNGYISPEAAAANGGMQKAQQIAQERLKFGGGLSKQHEDSQPKDDIEGLFLGKPMPTAPQQPTPTQPTPTQPIPTQPTIAPTESKISEAANKRFAEQKPVEEIAPQSFQDYAKETGKSVASFLDNTIGGVIPSAVGVVAYPLAKIVEATAKATGGKFDAAEATSAIVDPISKPFAKAFGIDENDPAYKKEITNRVMTFIGENVGEGSKELSDKFYDKTGVRIPVADLEYAANLGLMAVTGKATELGIKGIKSAKDMLDEQFAAKQAERPISERVEPGMAVNKTLNIREQYPTEKAAISPEKLQEQSVADQLKQQFDARTTEQIPVTQAANEPFPKTVAEQLQEQGQLKGVGSAEVTQPVARRSRAAELDVPIELSKDQITRNPADVRFARETAKDPVLGQALQEHYADQNNKIQQNLDIAIEKTGAELTGVNPGDLGKMIVDTITPEKTRRYSEVSDAYAKARDSGQMSAPIEINPIKTFLDKNSSAETNAPILKSVNLELEKLSKGKDTLSINDLEEVRKMVNNLAEPGTPNGKYGKDINRIIDDITKDQGGGLYRRARKLNAEFMTEFNDTPVLRDITAMKKGTTQRTVALEDLVDKSLFKGSLDDVKKLFSSMEKIGPEGQKMASELRGYAANQIKERATKGVERDINGKPYVSTQGLDKIIVDLDKSGKLDLIFGKSQADKYRTLNEVTKDVQTVPRGTTNPSGTGATVLAALAEMGVQTAATGLPVPAVMIMKHLFNKRETNKKLTKINEFINFGKETRK